ncbi:transposase [Sulfurimonas sp. MAG313]|nr:transposase [Sulfurimonas sp. MAG313]MDF1881297.1 transposase [Sulfurimonas sp. MAG313]
MPRRPRVEYPGYHHIINRGVARENIFLKEDDYFKFLEILEHTSKVYTFEVHSLCLMTNHYHLLIKTKSENLSLLARQINSKYAQYFNKEYKRVGPLWQGRFKSWFVHDENYLGTLVRYIEQNPIKANITQDIGEYQWCASTLLFDKNYENIFKNSILNDEIIFSSLDKLLEEGEIATLQKHLNEKYKRSEAGLIKQKQQPLAKHFKKVKSLNDRNEKIMLALKDGYTQGEVGRYLGLTSGLISQVNKSCKLNT